MDENQQNPTDDDNFRQKRASVSNFENPEAFSISHTHRSYTQQEVDCARFVRISVGLRNDEPSSSHQSVGSNQSLTERNAVMLFNSDLSDVKFRLFDADGKEDIIYAHTYILSIGSAAFKAMLYGQFDRAEEITVPDVDATAFRVLLTYLYTDEINLTQTNVLATLYAAKKYLVNGLIDACLSFLQRTLKSENVCTLLQQSKLFDNDDLVKICWQLLDAQAKEVLFTESFRELDFNTFKSIINRETLLLPEKDIFEAALCWAKHQCTIKNINPTPENLRYELGDAFYLIRYTTMDIEEFANGPAKSCLLSYEEITRIFMYFTADEKPILPYPTQSREGLKLYKMRRFGTSAYRANQWKYRGRCDSVQFSCTKRIYVAGFGFYGSSNGAAEFKVTITLKSELDYMQNGAILGKAVSKFDSDGSSSIFPVYFDVPLMVKPNEWHTITAVLDSRALSFFGQDGIECSREPNQENGALFYFRCSPESTNGTGVQGGQIPEILYYCIDV